MHARHAPSDMVAEDGVGNRHTAWRVISTVKLDGNEQTGHVSDGVKVEAELSKVHDGVLAGDGREPHLFDQHRVDVAVLHDEG